MTLSDVIRRREVGSTAVFAAGLLLLIVALGAGRSGTVWNGIHLFYFAVFGITGFFVPPAILFRGITDVLGISKRGHSVKIIEIFCLLAVVCGFLHIKNVSAVSVSPRTVVAPRGYLSSFGAVFFTKIKRSAVIVFGSNFAVFFKKHLKRSRYIFYGNLAVRHYFISVFASVLFFDPKAEIVGYFRIFICVVMVHYACFAASAHNLSFFRRRVFSLRFAACNANGYKLQ